MTGDLHYRLRKIDELYSNSLNMSVKKIYFSRSKMIRRLVLDVLKPHNPSVVTLSENLSEMEGIDGVNVIIYEIDQKVENAKVIIVGKSIDFESIRKTLEEMGATIHSIAEVAAGKIIVEEVMTPQDGSARI